MRSYYQFSISEPDLEIRNCFNGSFTNLIDYIDKNNIKFYQKKVGNNKLGQNIINKEIRSCQELPVNLFVKKNIFFKKFAEFLEEPDTENFFFITKNYDLLKYEEGDFFKEHQDTRYNKNHIGTILIYPPKKLFNYEGGELYLPKENVLIEAFENNWSMVLLHINTLHEVKPIISGTRYVFKQSFLIEDNVRILLENKLCENIELSIEKIEQRKSKEELELEIKHYEDILKNLKKEKFVLDNIDRCNTMVQDIIKSLKNGGVKIICQNYYENPSLDKLTGLDKNVIALIQKHIDKEIKIRMFNYDGKIYIGKSSEKWETIPTKVDNDYGEELDMTNQDFYYLPFDKYETYRISFDNMLTGNYQGLLSEYNDYEYQNYMKMKITIIIISI